MQEPKLLEKSKQLLTLLQEVASLRQKRIADYGDDGEVLWFADLPRDLPPCFEGAIRSPFINNSTEESFEKWLEVRKKRKQEFPQVPEKIKPHIPQEFYESPEKYASKSVDELLKLFKNEVGSENENLRNLWREYLINRWEPWVREYSAWEKIQNIYEKLDFMRRRVEESEEQYELVLAVGLLQWRDHRGVIVKRHILTAQAEIILDPSGSLLKVEPADPEKGFRVELDMLEPQDRPDLSSIRGHLENLLEELDIRAWDTSIVGKILSAVANQAHPSSQVEENMLTPLKMVDETFRIVFAPALVLRKRNLDTYRELVSRLREYVDKNADTISGLTEPWIHFIGEGEYKFEKSSNEGNCEILEKLYFPLPFNEEQRRIVEIFRKRPYVVVKGPPGTGKSHTIANLISHLLASGERVLVTAHAAKALEVLRDLLPEGIRDLCVTAFGSSSEYKIILENSVKTIISRIDSWNDKAVSVEIERLEKECYELEKKKAELENKLRQCCESETYSYSLPTGYKGTAVDIAKQLEREEEKYGWFPQVVKMDKLCLLTKEELNFFADFHVNLTGDREREIMMEVGDFELPSPGKFREVVVSILNEKEKLNTFGEALKDNKKLEKLGGFSERELEGYKLALLELEEKIKKAREFVSEQILKELLTEKRLHWQKFIETLHLLLKQASKMNQKVRSVKVDLPKDIEISKLLDDAKRRLEHFNRGGKKRSFLFTIPKVVKETQYIEEMCRVDSQPPKDIPLLEKLVDYLELKVWVDEVSKSLNEFNLHDLAKWMTKLDPGEAIEWLLKFHDPISDIVRLLEKLQSLLVVIPQEERKTIIENVGKIREWIRVIEIRIAQLRIENLENELQNLKIKIRSLPIGELHPCIQELIQAVEDRDPKKWQKAWEEREKLIELKKKYRDYQKLCKRLEDELPGFKDFLNSTRGNREWYEKISNLDKAWAWAATKSWLQFVTSENSYNDIAEQIRITEERLREKISRLTELKAWKAFFERLDEKTRQNLIAWQKAMARIGKGTGKFAYKHRRTARKYLQECLNSIPIWIMPLYKLWDTVEPRPGIFDTVIVDEASQAGIESLVLLLLGKRIIVVGDEKQNSPEAVGVAEEDVARLIREHLRDFYFREEFRPDSSLYDHAVRAFGNVITLREHFRCVPEIIRFSNDLCYRDSPLIPLRQPLPNRLRPLEAVYVENGFCEGRGQDIINRPEAEKIVEVIQRCIEDEAYKGKTMGVIVLQGSAQAKYIEKLLIQRIGSEKLRDKRLVCGTSATFQGDQRDVIFLSMVVAPNHNYRALTTLSDERRFNVAMSRARDQVWLFHSVREDELSPEDLRFKLLNFFHNSMQGRSSEVYQELEKLEREVRERLRGHEDPPKPYESWFEVDVALELLRRGYRIIPQYEVSGYRIDLVIESDNSKLAVECDGDYWHGVEEFTRDMARQRQLERAGWKFIRIRASEFYANRRGTIELVEEKCRELGIRPATSN